MITAAAEALGLPCAQLSEEERQRVKDLETEIENQIHQKMARRGMEVNLMETNPNVMAELGQRAKNAGYKVEMLPLTKRNRFNTAAEDHVGWRFIMIPGDEAYLKNPLLFETH